MDDPKFFLRNGILNTKLQVLGTHNLMVWLRELFKQLTMYLKKVVADNKDIYLAILELKNTHILNENYIPNEIMFNRNVRVILPKRLTRKINYNSNY
jgi:hypothetical protein